MRSDCTDLVVVPLNNLQEDSGSILDRFGEDLEEVTIIVVVHQNLQFLDGQQHGFICCTVNVFAGVEKRSRRCRKRRMVGETDL